MGVNAAWRFNRLLRSLRQSCASCWLGELHSRKRAMIRRANAPVDESNAASFMVDSCARQRTASGGMDERFDDSARTARGTTPSRIASRLSPNAAPPPPQGLIPSPGGVVPPGYVVRQMPQGYYVATPPNLAYAPGSPGGATLGSPVATAALGSPVPAPVAAALGALGGSPVQPPTKKPKTEHV